MHFKSVALMALASVAIAAPNDNLAKRQASVNTLEVSVLAVLATALPPSLVSIGLTNPTEVGAIIQSSFSAGMTPGWYSALPSDVKSYLPILYAEQTPTSATPSSTPAPSSSSASASAASSSSVRTVVSTTTAAFVASGASAVSASATISPAGNHTVISTVHSPTLSSPTTLGSESSSAATAASSTTSTGGASYPTAVMGAGIAGVMGFLGMLVM